MPIYEYACEKCGTLIDVLQKASDPAPDKCEKCGAEGPLSRRVSRTSFVLKGGGWYSDLYGSSKKDSSKDASKDSSVKDSAAKEVSTTKAEPSATTSTTGTSGGGSTSSTAPAPVSSGSASGEKK